MSELKPCPFCGNDARFYKVDNKVTCSNSSCIASVKYTPIDDWNTRPIEDAQAAEIERLKARVIELSNALLVEKTYNASMREALEWLVNLGCGVSRDGSKDISANEYGDAIALGIRVLEGEGARG